MRHNNYWTETKVLLILFQVNRKGLLEPAIKNSEASLIYETQNEVFVQVTRSKCDMQ